MEIKKKKYDSRNCEIMYNTYFLETENNNEKQLLVKCLG